MPKLTLVVFSGDLDKAVAAFLIASRAAVEGWEVVMLFTFWGLSVVRDPRKRVKRKAAAEKMFDLMLPSGAGDLQLSQMRMLGLGTSMMRKRMTAKNVLSVREMMKEAKGFGVRFLACALPMELFGVQKEELVDEVDEVCSIGRYLEEAKGAEVNLFF